MNTFLTADLHLGHKGVCEFLRNDGSKLRPWDNVEEMDEALIENHNSVVRPKDKVYYLGDIAINRKALPTLARLNGEKILVRGNHDIFRLDDYTPYFKDVRGTHKLDKYILSHIPIHPDSIPHWCRANIHGHLHSNHVMQNLGEDWSGDNVYTVDKRYYCVSVENTNYTPISLDEINKIMEKINA